MMGARKAKQSPGKKEASPAESVSAAGLRGGTCRAVLADRRDNAVLFRSIARTLSCVFEHQGVFLTDPKRPELVQNIFIVAASHDLAADSIRTRPGVNGELVERSFGGYVRPDQCDLSGGTVLTDEYNPVEYLVPGTLGRDDPTP